MSAPLSTHPQWRLAPPWLPGLTHPLIIAVGLGLVGALWLQRRRRTGTGTAGERDALLALALVMLVRCVLDSWDVIYYLLPFVLALLAWEVRGPADRPPVLALSSTVLAWISFQWLPSHAISRHPGGVLPGVVAAAGGCARAEALPAGLVAVGRALASRQVRGRSGADGRRHGQAGKDHLALRGAYSATPDACATVAGQVGPDAQPLADEMMQPAFAPTVPATGVDRAPARLAARVIFIALLAVSPLLPEFGNSISNYPAVSHFWVLLPFCGLFLLPLVDAGHLRRLRHVDLLVLLSFGIALGSWNLSRFWPLLFVYVPLAYLGVRMAIIARVGQSHPADPSARPLDLLLSRSWLIAGIAVLTVVHVSWTLEARVNTDVGYAGVQGALKILHGQPLYGADRAVVGSLGFDPHSDTYGPANYEAYIPFASAAGATTAARLATLFFDLLTAALLFALGRQVRGPTAGVTLAYAWLAFPFTLYTDGLATNDAMVAAALVGTLLVARSPARRGAMMALAAWTKLTPLALVPLMAGQVPPGRNRRLALLAFGAAFMVTSALAFVPALSHSSASMFLTRTFGFQISRAPGYSIWERLGDGTFGSATAWIKTTSGVAHGLIVALTGAFAGALLWLPRRRDVVGLAAASAAVLTAVLFCEGYYSFTYILWFAPLVLAALILDGQERRVSVEPVQEMTVSSFERSVSISRPLAATTTRSSIRTPS